MVSEHLKEAYLNSAEEHARTIHADYFTEEIWSKQNYKAEIITLEVKALMLDFLHYAMTRKMLDRQSSGEVREETLWSLMQKGGLYDKEAEDLIEDFAKELEPECRQAAKDVVKMALVRRSVGT